MNHRPRAVLAWPEESGSGSATRTTAQRAQIESICTLSENTTTMNSNRHGSDLNFACPKL
jgi:hypothetical protein